MSKRKPVTCRAQFRPGIELYCTRPKYHKGDHFERRGNALVASWPRVANIPGQPATRTRR